MDQTQPTVSLTLQTTLMKLSEQSVRVTVLSADLRRVEAPCLSPVYMCLTERMGSQHIDDAPKESSTKSTTPLSPEWPVRVLRMILDHLLLKTCLSGTALECGGGCYLSTDPGQVSFYHPCTLMMLLILEV